MEGFIEALRFGWASGESKRQRGGQREGGTKAVTAGVAPPGGVYQDGPEVGKAIAAKSTAFKIFKISDDVALFMSLGIVIVLVSIIPFRRRSMKRLLVVTHKAMWVAVTFMAIAYVAATWVVVPTGKGMRWLLVTVVTVGGGLLLGPTL